MSISFKDFFDCVSEIMGTKNNGGEQNITKTTKSTSNNYETSVDVHLSNITTSQPINININIDNTISF